MSSRSSSLFGTVRWPVGLRWMALAWLVAEVVVFMALVHSIGLGATLLLGLGTTVLGFVTLRRVGLDTLRTLRQSIAAGGAPQSVGLLDGLLSGLGAILLVIPGFVANAVGLALMAPSARGALIQRFGEDGSRLARKPARPGVIDLEPSDWTPIDRT